MNYKRDEGPKVGMEGTSKKIDENNTHNFYHSNGKNNNNISENKKRHDNQKFTKKKSSKRKNDSWKKGIVVLILAGLLIAVFFSPLYPDIQNLWGGPVYPERAHFSIQRTFDIRTNRDINYNMTLIVPEDIPENDIQYIRDVEWDGEPTTEKLYGRDWKYWEGSLSSGESKSIEIVYEAETRTLDWGYSSDDIGTVDDLPDEVKDRYNRNQWQLEEDRNGDGENDWMIQPDHPQIKSLAEDIVEGEENIYDKSRAIYSWINRNIKYELGGSGLPKHAYWVLESGSGDCDEQSFLYASLARAVEIPAYLELGVLYDRMANRWEGHGWIRQMVVNDEGTIGWINIDPVNNQFFARGANRITFWIDDGIEGHLNDYYYFFSWSPPGGVSVTENFKNIGMETEGQIILGDTDDIPGFTMKVAAPAVIISFFIFKVKKDS